jgi:hypothetical protein
METCNKCKIFCFFSATNSLRNINQDFELIEGQNFFEQNISEKSILIFVDSDFQFSNMIHSLNDNLYFNFSELENISFLNMLCFNRSSMNKTKIFWLFGMKNIMEVNSDVIMNVAIQNAAFFRFVFYLYFIKYFK